MRSPQQPASSRTFSALVDGYGDVVLPLQLGDAYVEAVKRAAGHFSTLDVVIKYAVYRHFGMIEELTEDEVRGQLETKLFGALWGDPSRDADHTRLGPHQSGCPPLAASGPS